MTTLSRREALRLMATTPPLLLLSGYGCASLRPTAAAQVVRKSAVDMSPAEVELFRRAYALVVENGTLDRFVAEHNDSDTHRMHEVSPDVRALVPHFMPPPGGQRFLAWHRAFLLEMEEAMRSAVRDADGEAAASRVFIPYWDASHAERMPAWLRDFRPTGIMAPAVAGIPEGHPGHGASGQYEVRISRWPGTILTAPDLPRPGHVAALLGRSDYTAFTRGLEWAPTLVRSPRREEVEIVERAASRLAGAADLAPLTRSLRTGSVPSGDEPAVFQALLQASGAPGRQAMRSADPAAASELERSLPQLFLVGPHSAIHLWVGGNDPENERVRGTATYFHETVADPAFWLLHAEVDRIWATWQRRHSGAPALTGEDAVFQPWEEGRRWTLDQLLDLDALPYRYDRPYAA